MSIPSGNGHWRITASILASIIATSAVSWVIFGFNSVKHDDLDNLKDRLENLEQHGSRGGIEKGMAEISTLRIDNERLKNQVESLRLELERLREEIKRLKFPMN